MDWCSVTVFANTAFALLIAAMIQQHCYYHHVVRQRVGLSSTPRFGLQVGVPTFGIHLAVCGSGVLYGGACDAHDLSHHDVSRCVSLLGCE